MDARFGAHGDDLDCADRSAEISFAPPTERRYKALASMDEKTVQYYTSHAEEIAARYETGRGPIKYFRLAFAEGARVLDIGSGSGRDASRLADDGHVVYGIDPSRGMRDNAVARHPNLTGRLLEGSLPQDLPDLDSLGGAFDGVLCSAVLQHLPRSALFEAVFAIRGILKPGGRVLVSIPTDRPGLDGDSRDPSERLYTKIVPGELRLLFERAGFTTIGQWSDEDSLDRREMRWVTFLFSIETSVHVRPLDLVAGVLGRKEKKVATYKFALFRALCDIALTQPRIVRWQAGRDDRLDDEVCVPVDAIASRWIRYYWPIFERTDHGPFLPQMNGEQEAGQHKLGFARELDRLMRCYPHGGLQQFVADEHEQRIPESAGYHALRLRVSRVIKEGPVKYAGGSLSTGRLFRPSGNHVILDAALWRELTLMGHWIQDALILRWAELTVRLSGSSVPKEKVISRLLVEAEAEHDTDIAREIFKKYPNPCCVWTGQRLDKRGAVTFAVDHLLPFSIWRRNDLWNLLPADPRVNLEKTDLLPKRQLLIDRRATIHDYWEFAKKQRAGRFRRDASEFTGEELPSSDTLFNTIVETVEFTAMQRGMTRWSPAASAR